MIGNSNWALTRCWAMHWVCSKAEASCRKREGQSLNHWTAREVNLYLQKTGWWGPWAVVLKLYCVTHSVMTNSAAPRTVAGQAPLSMGFSRQEYWSGLPFPSPGDLPHPGTEPRPPALQADAVPSEPSGKQAFQGCSSVSQFSRSVMCNSLQPCESQHARPPCPSPTPGVYSNSCPSSRWGRPAISSSVVPCSSFPQSLPASGSFPMSRLFAWGGQSIGVSASESVLPVNTRNWSPLGWTGWISLQSKGLSRVFSNITVQKRQFFGTQFSS